jgi:hypothetical protein
VLKNGKIQNMKEDYFLFHITTAATKAITAAEANL